MIQFADKELGEGSRHPAKVEAQAVFHRIEIQLFRHLGVYMHKYRMSVKRK